MGLFKRRKKPSHKKMKKAWKSYRKSSQGERAYCTTCHKDYDPNNKRQFRKHAH